MDGDLQNDPADILPLLEKLEQGYDLVSDWRKNRDDPFMTRVLPSLMANWVIKQVTRTNVHDIGCALKAYRREIINDIKLYGEIHCFLPNLAEIQGARVAEVPVSHHPRCYGQSKYGLERNFKLLMGLCTVYFFKKYLARPLHLFGFFGIVILGLAILLFLSGLISFLFLSSDAIAITLFWIIVSLGIIQLIAIALIFLSLGLLAELLTRTYHESQNLPVYRVRFIIE